MRGVYILVRPALALVVIFSSCSSYQQQAGLIGGLAGAAMGAAFGDDHQDVVAGAAVGVAAGAGGAAIHEQSRNRQYGHGGTPQDGSGGSAPQREGVPSTQSLGPADDPDPSPSHPLARRTNDPDIVESPYPPNHRINVRGFRSGQLAKDPKNGKIFRIP